MNLSNRRGRNGEADVLYKNHHQTTRKIKAGRNPNKRGDEEDQLFKRPRQRPKTMAQRSANECRLVVHLSAARTNLTKLIKTANKIHQRPLAGALRIMMNHHRRQKNLTSTSCRKPAASAPRPLLLNGPLSPDRHFTLSPQSSKWPTSQLSNAHPIPKTAILTPPPLSASSHTASTRSSPRVCHSRRRLPRLLHHGLQKMATGDVKRSSISRRCLMRERCWRDSLFLGYRQLSC